MTDPVTGLTLFSAITTVGKTVFNLAQAASNMDAKAQLMDVYDTLMNLKRQAGDLEDENRELKNKLRFKSEDFDFRNPFWYEKSHPDRPLCPKCFGSQKVSPMSERKEIHREIYGRLCLVCGNLIYL